MAGANLDADNMLAVFRVAFEDAVEIDILMSRSSATRLQATRPIEPS